MKVLVYGNGWLGNLIADSFDGQVSNLDILDSEAVAAELLDVRPDVVINAAGKCGRPNIDWCELSDDNKRLTKYANAYGPAILYHMVEGVGRSIQREIRFVHLSSGCLWENDTDVMEMQKPEPPSYYSETKAAGEYRLPPEKALIIRLRMPLSAEPHPRNFITKVSKYTEVLDSQNSMTVIEDLLPALLRLINLMAVGVYNVANPGHISPAEVMEMYKEIVDPNHQFNVTTTRSLMERGFIKAGRSNVTLNTDKLKGVGVELPEIRGRIRELLTTYAENLKEGQDESGNAIQ
jgi:3,5-epimerase/4-reductase